MTVVVVVDDDDDAPLLGGMVVFLEEPPCPVGPDNADEVTDVSVDTREAATANLFPVDVHVPAGRVSSSLSFWCCCWCAGFFAGWSIIEVAAEVVEVVVAVVEPATAALG